jgi:dienelactone hydrolase
MKVNLLCAAAAGCVALFGLSSNIMAQTNEPQAVRWLEKAGPVPQFTVAKSRVGWEIERKEVRAELNGLLGKLPPRPKVPAVTTLSKEDKGDFTVEKFQFDNGAGATVPGYLVVPKNLSGKAPAILYCHWHGGQYDVGKEELFHAKHTPDEPGPILAKRGYVVIAIDCYCFGERNGKGPGGPEEVGTAGEMTAAKFNLWVGRSLWGMILRDDLMALDYLLSRPEVDPKRVGVTGMSLGATRAWWLMALDERLTTGVAVACLTRYQNLTAHGELKAHGIYYFVPGMLNHFDTEAVIALIAPRPVLFMNGGGDPGSPTDGIEAIENAARPAWQLAGAEANFQSIIFPGQGHVYTPQMWERTLAWFDQKLKANP